ncbi:MAG: polysaccharide deacetylase family protein [Planctomycetes bacterium]|nr:polysaccharide deacetylase family protein [Planctomycetota bacterium]
MNRILMLRLIKLAISLLFWTFCSLRKGALRLAGHCPAPRLNILYYHAVPKDHASAFDRQMDRLTRKAHPVHIDARETDLSPGLNVAVSFDDAFESVAKNALPALARRKIPCTIFVPAGLLGKHPAWRMEPDHPDRKERIMDGKALQMIDSDRVKLASHTMTHPNLAGLETATLRFELVESKKRLEELLGHPVPLLSFPHGLFDERTLDLARQAGYERVYTITPLPALLRPEEYITGRFSVSAGDWPLEFHLKMLGMYRWIPMASRWKRKVTGLSKRCLKGLKWKRKAVGYP